MSRRKKIIIAILISAYVLLAFALTIVRVETRPAGDTTSGLALAAAAVIYLACSLGCAWLLEMLLSQWVPANNIQKQLNVELTHFHRKEKGVACGRQQYRKISDQRQQIELLRKKLEAAYLWGYQQGQANNNHHQHQP